MSQMQACKDDLLPYQHTQKSITSETLRVNDSLKQNTEYRVQRGEYVGRGYVTIISKAVFLC